MLSQDAARAMELLVLLSLALFIGVQAWPLAPRWRRRGLVLGAALLAAAVVFTVLAWQPRAG